jgi:hypothetical protein
MCSARALNTAREARALPKPICHNNQPRGGFLVGKSEDGKGKKYQWWLVMAVWQAV